MENAGIIYIHLEYFTVIWYILWPFGNVMVILVYFPSFLVNFVKKNLATLFGTERAFLAKPGCLPR
jgi:hypothetical protein